MAFSSRESRDITLNIVLEQPATPRHALAPSVSSVDERADDQDDDSSTNADNDDDYFFRPRLPDDSTAATTRCSSPSHSTVLGLRADSLSGSPSPTVRRTVLMSSPLSGLRNAALAAAAGRTQRRNGSARPLSADAISGFRVKSFVDGSNGSASLENELRRPQLHDFQGKADEAQLPLDAVYSFDDTSGLDTLPDAKASAPQIRQWIARKVYSELHISQEEASRIARCWHWLDGLALQNISEACLREIFGGELGWWIWWQVHLIKHSTATSVRTGVEAELNGTKSIVPTRTPLIKPETLIHTALALSLGFAFLAFDASQGDATEAFVILSALFGFLFLLFYCGFYFG